LPIDEVGQVTREAIGIAPNLIKNGYSPSLYIYAKSSPKDKLVGVVQAHSIDLLARSRVEQQRHDDAVNDLDQTPAGAVTPAKVATTGMSYERDPAVRTFVLKRAKGKCEYCGALGFVMDNDVHYLEAHHIVSLAKQGPDTVDNVIALCANHHRQAHYGSNKVALERDMLEKLAQLNKAKNS
jgi:5-methylcytosine-specific restriction protein A